MIFEVPARGESPFMARELKVILLMEEILHPLIGSSSHYLQGFIHPRCLFGMLGSLVCANSIVRKKPSLS